LQGLRLRGVERDMRHVVDNSFDAILTLDHAGSVLNFNAAAETLFGRSAEDAVGRPASELLEAETELAPGPVRTALARRGAVTGIPVELAISEVAGEERPRRVVFARDITEREAHREALEHGARHDILTGLPPPAARREARRGTARRRGIVTLGRGPLARPRPLQGDQRRPRPSDGRPRPARGGPHGCAPPSAPRDDRAPGG